MRRTIALLLVCGCAGPPPVEEPETPDPPDCTPQMFRGGPQRTGVASGTIPRELPEIAWAVNALGEPVGGGDTWWGGFPQGDDFEDELGPTGDQVFLAASPLVCGSRLITAWRTGVVTAHSPDDGELLWTYSTPDEPQFDGTPVVTSNRIYLGGTDGRVRALSTTTGQQVWVQLLAADTLASPALQDGVLVLSDKTGRVVALEADGGAERWRHQRGATVSSSPSFDGSGGTLLLGEIGRVETTLTSPIFALDAATGEELWTVDALAQVLSTAAWADGAWFVGSWDNHLYALADADGAEFWTFEADANISASPAVTDAEVIFGAWDWTLYSVDRQTGDERWRFDLGSDALASPVVDDATVLQATEDGRLIAVDRASGSELWTVDLGVRLVATPTVGGDAIYATGVNGDLVALSE